MSAALLKLENVWKIYSLGELELPVLKGVDLEIFPGSFVSIMGPSGSGKSTLMYLIGLLDNPTKGRVLLKDKDVSKLTEDELSKIRGQNIGFVFQQFNLLPNLSALENVMMPMIFQGTPEGKRQARALELLEILEMTKRMHHKPMELSGGEQQRVAIARSLVNNPEIIIADEPTGNLDSTTGKIIMKILTDFHKEQKKTIVVVTHDPSIAQYSGVHINIKDGEIVKNGKTERESIWQK